MNKSFKTSSTVNKKVKKIAVLVCFFGELPWYFDYFKLSCEYNPTVDFILITNQRPNKATIPKNLTIIHTTLKGVKKIASEKLGFNVVLTTPYKLCDLKPAYGIIFSDLLRKHDFWAHADLDIIFGNIRKFITDDLLEKHDLLCVRHDYLTGYFLLFRNKPVTNELFKQSKDFKKVFTSPKHYCFDETNFCFKEFAAGKPYHKIDSEIESMMHVVKRMEEARAIRTYFDFHVAEGLPGKLRWIEGQLLYKGRFEVLLYHLIFFKRVYSKKRRKPLTPRFSISPTTIYHDDEANGSKTKYKDQNN